MAEPLYTPDHIDRVLGRLPSQFKDQPNIEGLLTAWVSLVQELEDDLFDVKVKTEYFNAEGVNLDRYGHFVGLVRKLNEDDAHYRLRVSSEIVARSSDATSDSMRRVIEAVLRVRQTNLIEFVQPEEWASNGSPLLTGAVMLYGYADASSPRSILGGEAKMLRRGSPICTGSVVFGLHQRLQEDENSLFIPCELLKTSDTLIVNPNGDDTIFDLVDGVDRQIALSSGDYLNYAPGWEQGTLAELEAFVAEPLALDNTGFDGEELDVDTATQGVEAFNVLSAGIETTHGILLEIDQDLEP